MFIKKISLFLFTVAVSMGIGMDAKAVTIDPFLNFKTSPNHDAGYWAPGKMFFTFINDDNVMRPNSIHWSRPDFAAPALAGITFKEVFLSGSTVEPGTVVGGNLSTGILDGKIVLYGNNREVLLFAEYVDNGTVGVKYAGGFAGNLDINGEFRITGGSLFTSGLVEGSLLVDVAYDYVWQNKYKDLKASYGTYNLSLISGGTTPPTNPIPEPATMTLLGVSAAGLISRRRKSLTKA
jgi:hypothetical protein